MAAVALARTAVRIAEAAHHRGTALPGLVAERVWPDALRALAGQLHTTVVVIGTNGKTTTAGLIAEILGDPGPPPLAYRRPRPRRDSGAARRGRGRGGDVMSLVRRAEARSIVTSVLQVRVGAARIPAGDLVFIGFDRPVDERPGSLAGRITRSTRSRH